MSGWANLFLLQLWKTRGLGTTTPREMTMTTMRLKKNLSEEHLYLFSYVPISQIVI
jgi:hypothetical protein